MIGLLTRPFKTAARNFSTGGRSAGQYIKDAVGSVADGGRWIKNKFSRRGQAQGANFRVISGSTPANVAGGTAGAPNDLLQSVLNFAASPDNVKLVKGLATGGSMYVAGSAVKGFSAGFQETLAYEDMSSGGQFLFRGAAFVTGTALQFKGVTRGLGAVAQRGAASAGGKFKQHLQWTADKLDGASRYSLTKGAAKGLWWAGKGTVKTLGNTVGGMAQIGSSAAMSGVSGLLFGPRAGMQTMAASIATMKNPYLGAMGIGMAAGGYMAFNKPVKKPQPKNVNKPAMNRGNYNRVSQRARRMGA